MIQAPEDRRKLPLTGRELMDLRQVRLVDHTTNLGPLPDDKFTCDDCKDKYVCRLVFDLYNVNGDCLAEK